MIISKLKHFLLKKKSTFRRLIAVSTYIIFHLKNGGSCFQEMPHAYLEFKHMLKNWCFFLVIKRHKCEMLIHLNIISLFSLWWTTFAILTASNWIYKAIKLNCFHVCKAICKFCLISLIINFLLLTMLTTCNFVSYLKIILLVFFVNVYKDNSKINF